MDSLTLDLGGTKMAAAWWQGGAMVRRLQQATPRDARDVLACLGAWIREGPPVQRVGAAITGTTDGRRIGALNRTLIEGWDGLALAERLEAFAGVPACLLNDAQAAAWGEFQLQPQTVRDLLFITVSTGLGGGLVLDGALRTGRSGLAGHLGHTGAGDLGARARIACSCGRGPCLERQVSGTALSEHMADRGLGQRSAQAWLAPGEAAHPAVDEWLAAATRRLAHAIVDAHAMLDLQCVLVGGGLGLEPRFLHGVQQAIATMPQRLQLPVGRAQLGADAGLQGMARWLERATGPHGADRP